MPGQDAGVGAAASEGPAGTRSTTFRTLPLSKGSTRLIQIDSPRNTYGRSDAWSWRSVVISASWQTVRSNTVSAGGRPTAPGAASSTDDGRVNS